MCVEGFLLILIVRRHRRIDRSKFLRPKLFVSGTLKKEGGVRAKREKTRVDSNRPLTASYQNYPSKYDGAMKWHERPEEVNMHHNK